MPACTVDSYFYQTERLDPNRRKKRNEIRSLMLEVKLQITFYLSCRPEQGLVTSFVSQKVVFLVQLISKKYTQEITRHLQG